MRLPTNVVLVGDARRRLAELPADSIDCVVTSPPYWALRDYQVAGQLGLEATVVEWVEHLRSVLDEVARVLKPTGSLWLNVGDSYARSHRHGAPPKSLVLGPERLLLSLVDSGWVVRSKIVWAKPNPLPSSVRDRLNTTWEPLYLLTRSRQYFFDLDAIRVPHRSRGGPAREPGRPPRRPLWAGPLAGDQAGLDRLYALGRPGHVLGKNPGDVWTITTSNYRGGHHATFPPALVQRPLLAGCPERVCTACGRPWFRLPATAQLGHLAVIGELAPGCGCPSGWQAGVVLDPFLGSGTTAVVAERLGRRWIGIELSRRFARLAEERIAQARSAADAA